MTTISSATDILPDDGDSATLAGRVFNPAVGGPSVVAIRAGGVVDVSAAFPTMRELTEHADPAGALAAVTGPVVGTLDEIAANTPDAVRDTSRPWLLSPIDLHVVKAAGVTFPVSMIERIIEERMRGEAHGGAAVREDILGLLGGSLDSLVPGSREAAKLKKLLMARGWWSQYLEVGIGPDAEIFTKAPVLSTVGSGSDVGVLAKSEWNNPEPEVVLVVSSEGQVVGAALGNDVNLRDIEGRSALLLGKAKDNNASASVGPFVRFFDEGYGLDDVRRAVVTLTVEGTDGFKFEGTSLMGKISRDPSDLVEQAIGAHHSYPDGLVLYLGTLFTPIEDRGEEGRGFTHHVDDIVTIREPHLGSLINRVQVSEKVAPWTFGISALYWNLAERGLLSS